MRWCREALRSAQPVHEGKSVGKLRYKGLRAEATTTAHANAKELIEEADVDARVSLEKPPDARATRTRQEWPRPRWRLRNRRSIGKQWSSSLKERWRCSSKTMGGVQKHEQAPGPTAGLPPAGEDALWPCGLSQVAHGLYFPRNDVGLTLAFSQACRRRRECDRFAAMLGRSIRTACRPADRQQFILSAQNFLSPRRRPMERRISRQRPFTAGGMTSCPPDGCG